jgi:hypothetical protein
MSAIAKSQENRKVFECKICDYKTCNNYDFKKHQLTIKHLSNVSAIKSGDLAIDLSQKSPDHKFLCNNCNKTYKDNSGLWRHKKICATKNTSCDILCDFNSKTENDNKSGLINYLIKENQEFKNLILEIVKKDSNNSNCNNITTTNSNNKSFNLQFFLNETCKDAMNITDFVESIKLQLTDLERVGELGYVEGISNIIVKNLKELDITQRPVHCTDKKRETMYIKDENTWEKDEEKKKMHKLVKKVADKNMRLLPEYREKHPDYIKASSLCSDKYNQIFLESLGGSGDNDFEKEEKIIKNVSREVFVQKSL